MIFEGFARSFLTLRSGVSQIATRFTFQESVAVAQVEPPNFEMSRAGRRMWLGNSAGVTGIAPVQAIPTTAPAWVIWNGDASASYLFEEITMFLTSGTPGLGGSMWACLFQTPVQLGVSATGLSVASMSNGSRLSKAVVKSGVTITQPTAPVWFPLATNSQNITAAAFSAGYSMNFTSTNLQGALIVPPGQGIGLSVLGPTGSTPLWAPAARWVELETSLE